MPWTQLFKVKNFEQALAKRRNVFHIDPILCGRNLAKVKKVFRMVEIPFVWDAKDVLRTNNEKSPYHKFPKGVIKEERRYFERLLKLRTGIAAAKEKELKFRQDSLNKRPYKGLEQMIKLTMPFMIKPTSQKPEGAFGGKSRSRKMVAEFVKEVPRNKNLAFGRRNQERVKNLMEDKVIDAAIIAETSKSSKTSQQPQAAQKVEEKKKANANTTAYVNKSLAASDNKANEAIISKKVLDALAGGSSDDE